MTLDVPAGPWDPDVVEQAQRTPIGALVVDGVVACNRRLGSAEATELVGCGEAFYPWPRPPISGVLHATPHWSALTACRLLVIAPATLHAALTDSDLIGALYAACVRRTASLAVHHAIAQLPRVDLRILVLLWHLATRWGEAEPDGVVLPLPLSHARLGELVGAQRSTVTLALRRLSADGRVQRRTDGSWQLGRRAPEMLRPDCTGDVRDEVVRNREQTRREVERLMQRLSALDRV